MGIFLRRGVIYNHTENSLLPGTASLTYYVGGNGPSPASTPDDENLGIGSSKISSNEGGNGQSPATTTTFGRSLSTPSFHPSRERVLSPDWRVKVSATTTTTTTTTTTITSVCGTGSLLLGAGTVQAPPKRLLATLKPNGETNPTGSRERVLKPRLDYSVSRHYPRAGLYVYPWGFAAGIEGGI